MYVLHKYNDFILFHLNFLLNIISEIYLPYLYVTLYVMLLKTKEDKVLADNFLKLNFHKIRSKDNTYLIFFDIDFIKTCIFFSITLVFDDPFLSTEKDIFPVFSIDVVYNKDYNLNFNI